MVPNVLVCSEMESEPTNTLKLVARGRRRPISEEWTLSLRPGWTGIKMETPMDNNIDNTPTSSPKDKDAEGAHSPMTQTLEAGAAPISSLIEKAPGEVGETLTQRVAAALQTALDHSQAMFNAEDMELRLKKARAYPGDDTSGGHENHLATIEEAVRSLRTTIKTRTVIGSCVTGFMGPVGQLADIPAFYLYAVHSLQEIAISYGFDPRKEHEQKYILQLLRIGHVPGQKKRDLEVDQLDSIDIEKDLATIPEISYALSGRGLTLLARQLLSALFRRKAVAMIPIFGAFVNAGINNHLMESILEVGQRSYRRRFARRAQMIAADRAQQAAAQGH